jgi:hypothetical protein
LLSDIPPHQIWISLNQIDHQKCGRAVGVKICGQLGIVNYILFFL